MLPYLKIKAIYLLNSAHKFWKHYFVYFQEALQFEATIQYLLTFHMDLHPPTMSN
jgi:hypothetical protein